MSADYKRATALHDGDLEHGCERGALLAAAGAVFLFGAAAAQSAPEAEEAEGGRHNASDGDGGEDRGGGSGHVDRVPIGAARRPLREACGRPSRSACAARQSI